MFDKRLSQNHDDYDFCKIVYNQTTPENYESRTHSHCYDFASELTVYTWCIKKRSPFLLNDFRNIEIRHRTPNKNDFYSASGIYQNI